MITKLEKLRRTQYICEDCWYSCPKSGECCNDFGTDCACGADQHNALLDEIIKDVKELIASRDKLEIAFEYADREARLAIEEIKILEATLSNVADEAKWD